MSQQDKVLRIVQGVHIQEMNGTANQLLCIFEKNLRICEKYYDERLANKKPTFFVL